VPSQFPAAVEAYSGVPDVEPELRFEPADPAFVERFM
jgi:hypothetical protein